MSTGPSTSTSHSNFVSAFNAAMELYKRKTKIDLASHALLPNLQSCNSPEAILTVLREQIPAFSQSENGDGEMTKWVTPTVKVLYVFSDTLGQGGLAFPSANVIFAGISVLLSTAKDLTSTSRDKLIDIFDRIGYLFDRIEVYTGVTPTAAMRDRIKEIMVGMLTFLAITTEEVKRGRLKKYLKKLTGDTGIEVSLARLDGLTQEWAHKANTEVLRETSEVVVVVRVQAAIDNRQLRDNFLRWLSPTDPSTNHNIARNAHHNGTAKWFFQGAIFNEWSSTGSFLWIHGKLGSGKSILCSSIIQDAMNTCDFAGASLAYFYFDYRDADKQNLRNLLPSLLIQLSARSDRCCDILSRLYSSHDHGVQKPSNRAMIECLKEMLTVDAQGLTYIILGALDECPVTSTVPSPREEVLELVDELVGLGLPHVLICVTSRPEHDIRAALKHLTPLAVSLHDESGQLVDIDNYIAYFVHSDQRMRRWREEDKDLVIKTLSEKVDGMFRWAFFQLEVLRHSFPSSIRLILEELPESLDETYERILREIRKPNQGHAHRLLQCLIAAARPLLVKELAEVLTFDFSGEGIPKQNPGWRWEDQEEVVMSACSSLVMTVEDGYSRVVQLSHSSIKTFLTQDRLADPIRDVSRYHIQLEDAHTILAQACLGVLLRLDDQVDRGNIKNFPLARYAAQFWPTHARFASSRVKDGMDSLFDTNKPHFARWLWIYDEDMGGPTVLTMYPEIPQAAPLYYAARLGFYDLAERLIAEHPEHVNARGGHEVTSMHVATREGHVDIVSLLLEHGGDVDGKGITGQTPLHVAVDKRNIQVVQLLLEHGADVNARTNHSSTPLHVAARGNVEISRMLLEHGTNVAAEEDNGGTPLHEVPDSGSIEIIRVLLLHGASVGAEDNEGKTPLHVAARGNLEISRVLLDHGANAGAEDHLGRTPLQVAAQHGSIEVERMLFEHDADVNARS